MSLQGKQENCFGKSLFTVCEIQVELLCVLFSVCILLLFEAICSAVAYSLGDADARSVLPYDKRLRGSHWEGMA